MAELDKLKQKMATMEGFGKDNVLAIMIGTRATLEELGQKQIFSHVNFYANWCVHPELSQGATCYNMLDHVTDILLSRPDVDPNLPWFNDAMVATLDLARLRREFIDFYTQHRIEKKIFENYDLWLPFTAFLRDITSERPIAFQNNPAGAARVVYDRVKGKADANNGLGAKELFITSTQNNGSWTSHWNVVLFKEGVTVQGPFALNEDKF